MIKDHPVPVATTWSLSFEKVERKNLSAADLLRVCAFLSPDAIPLTIISEGASHLGSHLATVGADPYLLNAAIEVLRAYSLLRREIHEDAGTFLWMHHLVQAVVQDSMDEPDRKMWAEQVMLALSVAFPSVEHQHWSRCDRFVPHVLSGVALITIYQMHFSQVALLLNQGGLYLYQRARYQEAEPLLEQALAMSEQELGVGHPTTATSLNNLAALYEKQCKYSEAELLHMQALAMYEQVLGANHLDAATSLNNLAELYKRQGKYVEAEALYVRALTIREQQLGGTHLATATSLITLAELYREQGKYAEAEPLYVRALAIDVQTYGAAHPDVAIDLNDLALLYYQQGKYAEAEPLYVQVLAIYQGREACWAVYGLYLFELISRLFEG